MAISKAQQKAVHKYVKANYDRMELTVPKGRKEEIKAYAENHGKSVNAFIMAAIDEKMQHDTTAPSTTDSTPAPSTTAAADVQPIQASQTIPEAGGQPQNAVLHLVERGLVDRHLESVEHLYTDPSTEREYYVEPVISDREWEMLQTAKQNEDTDPDSLPF